MRRRRTALLHVLVSGRQPFGRNHHPIGAQARMIMEHTTPVQPSEQHGFPVLGVDTRLHTRWELKPHFSAWPPSRLPPVGA